jgi:hypothetical protein
VPQRVARYKERMLAKGMMLVQVWVPSEKDADEIKLIAAEMRQRASEVSNGDTET